MHMCIHMCMRSKHARISHTCSTSTCTMHEQQMASRTHGPKHDRQQVRPSTNACMHACTHAHMHASRMHACMHVCMHASMHTCACMHTQAPSRAHTQASRAGQAKPCKKRYIAYLKREAGARGTLSAMSGLVVGRPSPLHSCSADFIRIPNAFGSRSFC